jgi:hypothetical protein
MALIVNAWFEGNHYYLNFPPNWTVNFRKPYIFINRSPLLLIFDLCGNHIDTVNTGKPTYKDSNINPDEPKPPDNTPPEIPL